MAENSVQLEANLSISALIQELRDARAEGERLRADLISANKDIKAGFEQSAGAAGTMGREINSALQKIDAQTNTIKSLTAELENLKKSGATAFDASKLEAYKKKIQELEGELKNLKTDTKESSDATVQGATAGAKAIDILKAKLGEAKENQRLLKLEVKDFGTAIKTNDKAIATTQAELSKLSKASSDYKARSAELKAELQALYQKQEVLNAGLLNAQRDYEKTTASVKQYSKEVIVAEINSGKFGKGLGSAFSSLKDIANILPGIGIAGIIGFLSEGIFTVAGKLVEYVKNLNSATTAAERFKKQEEDAAKILNESGDAYVKATFLVDDLKEKIQLAKEGFIDKDKVVKIYNETIGRTTGKVKDLDEAEKELTKNGAAYIQMMFLKAAANLALEDAAKKALEAEQTRRKKDAEFKNELTDNPVGGSVIVTPGSGSFNAADYDRQTKEILAAQKRRKDQLYIEQQGAANDLKTIADKFNRDAAEIAKQFNFNFIPDEDTKTGKGKKVIDTFKDRSAEILRLEKELADARIGLMEESRQKEIAIEAGRFDMAVKTLELLKEREARAAQDILKKPKLSDNDRKELAQISEELKLADKNIEIQKAVHNAKLLAIDKKYYEDARKAFDSAQDAINGVLLEGQDKDIADVQKRYDAIRKAIEDARKKLLQTTSKPLTIGLINANAQNQTAQVTEQQKKDEQEVINKYDDKRMEEQKALALATINILRVQGVDEKALIELKERLKLQTEKTFGERRLEQLKQQYKLETVLTDNIVKALSDPKNIKAATERGVDIFQFLGIQITDEKAKAKIIAAIKQIQDAAKGIATGEAKSKTDLFDFLGIDADMEAKIKNIVGGISTIGDETAKALNPVISIIDQQIQKRQELIDSIQKEIDTQKEAVDKQRELAEKGFANNLGLEQRRLTDLEKSKAKEIELNKKADAEKRKLQKAQLIADTIGQTSSLISASAKIFDSVAAIPFAGVPLAIATIGVMLAGFAAAKISAFKAIDNAPKMRKGGKLDLYNVLHDAPTHEQGGVGLYDERSGRKLAEVERKEKLFVVSAENSRKYEPILDAINRDELSKMSVNEIGKLIRPTDISFSSQTIKEKITTKENRNTTTINNSHTVNGIRPEHMERLIKSNEAIAETNKKMLDIEMQRPLKVQDTDEATIEKYPNGYTRITKKG